MIPVPGYEARAVAVFGLGRTGRAAAKALTESGAKVLAWDDKTEARAAAEADGLTLTDLTRRDWGDVAALILSPGVPFTHPDPHRIVSLAKAMDVPVMGDMELFAQAIAGLPDVTVIGVTGTNGKSTTTALIGHILKAAGRDVRVGGNLGQAVLGLDPPRPGAVYVLELSSYQLDLVSSLRCQIAVFLNLSEDHLDRHGGMDGYLAAKKRIFRNQSAGDAAVIGVDDPHTERLFTQMRAAGAQRLTPISSGRVLAGGIYAVGGALYDASSGRAETVIDLAAAPALPGRHNAQNAAAAYAAARLVGLSRSDAAAGLGGFPGLAHRQEVAGRRGRVLFINDSKATNAEAAAQALSCYSAIYWIVGGQAKAGGLRALRSALGPVRQAYLIGQDAPRLAGDLEGLTPTVQCGTLAAAVAAAARDAAESQAAEPVVLLSPACASFDQFKDFEDRGDQFRALVAALPAVELLTVAAARP